MEKEFPDSIANMACNFHSVGYLENIRANTNIISEIMEKKTMFLIMAEIQFPNKA